MGALAKARSESLNRSRQIWNEANKMALGNQLGGGGTFLDAFGENRAERRRYDQFRGWLYSAINVLATEGAGQSPTLAQTLLSEETTRSVISRVKGNPLLLTKQEQEQIEILTDHEIAKLLLHPNPIQYSFQFVYSFIANLLLTGWGFIVGGEGENGLELYSLPSTWITPDHSEEPFGSFKLRNPKKPNAEEEILTKDQVAVACLPNPSDPLGAMAPAMSQQLAIKVDDHIQTSQEKFFDNGIFPSVVVTVGKNPHPDVPGGIRPRLTASQRRQIHGVLRRTMGSVANYGTPAIVDGMIESITRLSATQNEMGWEKSEDKVKSRILSAFGLHPFAIGEQMAGSYAQAYVVDDRTCRKINCYLSLLGVVLTDFLDQEGLQVVYTPCEPSDPTIDVRLWETGLKNNAIRHNEYRAHVGLPPIEEGPERNTLLSTVGGMQGTLSFLQAVGQGSLSPESASQALSLFLQIPSEEARALVGAGPALTEEQALAEATGELRSVVKFLSRPRIPGRALAGTGGK